MDIKKKNNTNAGPFEAEGSSRSSLGADTRINFLFNKEGGVWLLHDKPLPDTLKWVEYDTQKETVTLVTRDGRISDLGVRIPADKSFYLERAMEVTTLLMDQGRVADFAIVPMVTANMTVN